MNSYFLIFYMVDSTIRQELNKRQIREIVLRLMIQQLEDAPHALEHDRDYQSLSIRDIESILNDIKLITYQFKKRYGVK